jgi:formate dehydrogenase subunit gamma
MKRSFSGVLRTLVLAAGLSLTLASVSYAERAPMAPLHPQVEWMSLPCQCQPIQMH